MKPTELRIGNYVWEEYGGIYEVVNINSKGYPYLGLRKPTFKAIGSYDIGVIKPIPLTEEWLVKFGFISDNYNVYYITDNKKATGRANLWVHCFDKDGEIYWDCHVGVEFGELTFISVIKYVHSLQNLYHALTGEELTIKTK